ncbi:MAG: type VI secretion system baseplate subunit TssG [bacterium]|nr:type VI secretion system baseplate subunit TssG [bacterium]
MTANTPNTPRDASLPPIVAKLLDNPTRFTFYQALRLLEQFAGGEPLGQASLPRHEAIRLRALASFSFPPSDLYEIRCEDNPWLTPPRRYLVGITFMGLYGPASPLPAVYTDILVRPQEEEDPEDRERVRAFFDLFHHRLFSLFYRCLSKYRYHLLYRTGGADTFSQYMLSLIGRGTAGMRGQRPIPADHMIRYAGLLTHQPRSASGLEGLIRDYLANFSVRIEQCMGRWLRVEDRNKLGGAFCTLGGDMIVGANVYDRTGKFRVRVGPMGFRDFQGFLPTGTLMARLRELVRLYLVDELEFDVEIVIRGEEIPPLQMGLGAGAAMLGWTSWAQTKPGPDRSVVFRG